MQPRLTTIYNKERESGKGGMSDFTTRKSVEFYKLNSISYRTEVAQTTDGRLYVSLARYWLSPQSKEWVPTAKQVFMPVAAWKNMKQAISLIDDSLDEIMPRKMESKCKCGINYFTIYYLCDIDKLVYKGAYFVLILFSNFISELIFLIYKVSVCDDSSADIIKPGDGVARGPLPGTSLPLKPAAVGRRPRGRPAGSRGASSAAGLSGAGRELVVVNPAHSIFKCTSPGIVMQPRKSVHFGFATDPAAKKAKLQSTCSYALESDDDDDDGQGDGSIAWSTKAAAAANVIVPAAVKRDAATCSAAAAAESEGDGGRQPCADIDDDEADALIRSCDSQYPC